MPRRNRFNRFHHRPQKPPVYTSGGIQARKGRCQGCHQMINPGETFTRLRLRPDLARPCGSCGVAPKRSKRFHAGCAPTTDTLMWKAMGYDPTKVPPPFQYGTPQPSVAPPPKPPTFGELAQTALVSLEAALLQKCREKGVTKEMDKEFKTYQGIKARVLRPGTPAEGETATYVALQRILKLVYA